MFLFNKEEEKDTEKKEVKKVTASIVKKSPKNSAKTAVFPKKTAVAVSVEKSDFIGRFLLKPWITEKSQDLMELNKYVFKASSDASKKSVRRSVEDFYNVEVKNVRIINIPARQKITTRNRKKAGYKKAIVSLKKGNKIEFFEKE